MPRTPFRYRPIDECLERPLVRMLRALRWFSDGLTFRELLDVLGVEVIIRSRNKNWHLQKTDDDREYDRLWSALRFGVRSGYASRRMSRERKISSQLRWGRALSYTITERGKQWLAVQLEPDVTVCPESEAYHG